MNTTQQDDARLILQFMEGDDSSFETLYGRYANTLFQYIYRRCGDAHLANDTVQSVFFRVVRNPEKFTGIEHMKSYLLSTARNELQMWRRKWNKGVANLAVLSDKFLETESYTDIDDCMDVADALKALPEEHADIVLMHHREGLTFREIGSILDVSPNTVADRYYRALEKLKQFLS